VAKKTKNPGDSKARGRRRDPSYAILRLGAFRFVIKKKGSKNCWNKGYDEIREAYTSRRWDCLILISLLLKERPYINERVSSLIYTLHGRIYADWSMPDISGINRLFMHGS
jgi:hypothetical protein